MSVDAEVIGAGFGTFVGLGRTTVGTAGIGDVVGAGTGVATAAAVARTTVTVGAADLIVAAESVGAGTDVGATVVADGAGSVVVGCRNVSKEGVGEGATVAAST